MCGIAGCVNFVSGITQENISKVKVMTNAMHYRGPDASGFFNDEFVSFGHRRLSIIDLSENSNQPLKNEAGNIIITFNGEIYNHSEIRKELEKEYAFATNHSDTEVIIYAYKKWGIACIHRFTGMFAFALYDKLENKVFLIRDRLGKKPLYYTRVNDGIYFSSEIQPFIKAQVIKKELNEEAVYNYLTFLTTNAPNTFFKNISKLEAGHYITIFQGDIRKEKYWDIADFINSEKTSDYGSAFENSEALLEKSMMYRNVADTPITLALSGGIDSSLNAYYCKKVNVQIDAVNVSYSKTSRYDESLIASNLAKELDLKFNQLQIDDEIFHKNIIEYLNIQQDMPVGDPNTILIYYMSKYLKSIKSKILIVGEGGDELGAYPVYLKYNKEYRFLKYLRPVLSVIKHILPMKFANIVDCYFNKKVVSKRHIHGFSELEKKKFWTGKPGYNSYGVIMSYMDEVRNNLKDSFLRKILNVEYKLRLPELILSRIDYPSMAASIEARSPFMDHKLIEYSASLSFGIKTKHGAKSIFKQIAKEKLPNYIVNHKKVGFGMLLTPFLQETLPVWYYREILEKPCLISKYLDKNYLENIYNQHRKTKSFGYKLWIIHSLNKWLEINKFN